MAAPPVTRSSGTVLSWSARALLDRVANSESPRAYLVGPSGSGKTTLLRRLADELTSLGREVQFVDGTDPLDPQFRGVLLVDDLHRLDPDLLDAVRQRATDPNAGLLVSARPWPVSPTGVEIAVELEHAGPPVLLGRVARSDVLTHLDEQGIGVDESCVDHVLQCTKGLTWLVSIALAAHDRRDCVNDPAHDALEMALRSQIIHRLETMPKALRLPLTAYCASEQNRQGPAGDHDRELILQGHAHGLLRRSGVPAPVVRAAARSATATAASMPGPTGGSPDQQVIQRALAAWNIGDVGAAASLIDAASPTPESPEYAAVRDTSAAVWASRAMMTTASDVYFFGHGHHDGRSAALATVAHAGAGHADRLAEAPASTTADPHAHGTTRIALGLLDRGLRETLRKAPGPDALANLLRATELYTAGASSDPVPEIPAVIAAAAALGCGEPVAARHVIEAAADGSQGGASVRRRLLLWQAWLLMEGERPQEARTALEAAEQGSGPGQSRDDLVRESVAMGMARRYDTRAALEATWRSTREQVRHMEIDLFTIIPFTTILCSAASAGDETTLSPHLDRALAIVADLGNPPVWGTHLWWAGVQRGILLNRPDLVEPHARALVAASSANRVAAVMASAGRVWMSVLAGSVELDAVEAAARALAAAGCAWDGARLAAHGSRRSPDKRIAGQLLSVARELHPREPGQSTSTATNSASAQASMDVSVLSDREFDVAVLVLEGRTYNEIGQTVFISPKTVEHHVARIKRRIGASSRSDMMAKLRILVDARSHASERSQPSERGGRQVSP